MIRLNYVCKIVLIILVFFIASCVPKKVNQELTTEQKFIENSIRTWKSIDIAADALYSIFGELYKHDVIGDDERDILIKIGTPLASTLTITKASIETYLLAVQTNEGVESAHQKVMNSLMLAVHLFHNVKDEVERIYKFSTGREISLPEINIFPELEESINLEVK